LDDQGMQLHPQRESARQSLVGLLEISSVEAGLQTVGWLGGALSAESATRAAAARGVEVVPLSAYHRGRPTREGLQLGFAAVDAKEIRRGVTELASALEMESKGIQRAALSSARRTQQGPTEEP
jgi:GntR family transcriptional regulator / MocR family aminotransferase